ncbi:MAG: LysR family transcriptional regulator [Deltaproteobacteria bacterium]|nr:LysR family transcriptional regulator [Deltaproteobacteria bacterium]
MMVTAMDTELLRTFLQVAQTGRFRVAASRLCVTQSAVSARIRLLEEEMGTRLFQRSKQGAALTVAGQRLVRHAETLLDGWNRCCQEVVLPSESGALLSVGSIDSLWTIYLMHWLVSFREAVPELVIRADISSTEDLLHRIIEGQLDLVVVFETPSRPQILAVELATLPMVMVSSRRRQRVEDAMAEGYVFIDWSPTFSSIHLQHFPGDHTSHVRTSVGRVALDHILLAGGAAYFPEPMVRPSLEKRRLYRVADAPEIPRPVYALRLAQRANDDYLSKAVAHLEETVARRT